MTARQTAKLDKIAAQNPGLGYRDLRDLLIEYGADSDTATAMAEGRD